MGNEAGWDIHGHLSVSVGVLHHDGVVVGRVVHRVGQVLLARPGASESPGILFSQLHRFCHNCQEIHFTLQPQSFGDDLNLEG